LLGYSARWRRLAPARDCSGSPLAAASTGGAAGGEAGGAAGGDADVRGSARWAISRSSWSKIGVDITLSRVMRALLYAKIP
jgi:hypothetical protein